MSAELSIDDAVEAARRGDERAFGVVMRRFRAELMLHCYRMLGSYDDAEDALQDTWLQVWRGLSAFEARSTLRTWIYRIATNVCLARRTRDQRRRTLLAPTAALDGVLVPLSATVPWLQAFPDTLLEEVRGAEPDPAELLTRRETVEIAFVAGLQHLPGRQLAVVVLRDAVGWSAQACADELDLTVPTVNGLLRRARATLRQLLGADRDRWPAATPDASAERDLLRRYITAIEAGDDTAIATLLRPDAVVSHQPMAGSGSDETGWYEGVPVILQAWAPALHGPGAVDMRLLPVWVNRMPAVASYARTAGRTGPRLPFGLAVLRVVDAQVAEVVNLGADQFSHLGLPATMP